MRTAHLLRRGWRATLLLALVCGLAGGIGMAGWSAGRRASTAFDRFVDYADPPELLINFGPPGLEQVDEQ